jgi:glycerol kinase
VVSGPSPGLILALDQGGHASRAVLFDLEGRVVSDARVPVSTTREPDGVVEQDPVELVQSLRSAIDDACRTDAGAGRPVVAAGLATQRSTVVCWERSSGRALTPAISWQDRRASDWVEQLRPLAARIRALTGLVLSPHYGASKLHWCLEHVPGVARAARAGDLACGPLASYLLAPLLDEAPLVADPSNASRTLLFEPDSLDWSPPLLDAFAIGRATLPDCVPTRHAYGHLRVAGMPVPLTACTGDQSAAALAFGPADTTVALVNLGTGAFAQRAVPPGASLPDGLLKSVLCSDAARALYSHEGTVNGAGSALDWLAGRVALDVPRALAALDVGPGDRVPLFMNGAGGLGSPYWLPDFPVEFVGGAAEELLVASVVESVVFLLAVNLEAMQQSAPLSRIVATGGLAGCDYLCQALADTTGLAVERPRLREATARGIAFLAAGEPGSWAGAPLERRFAPHPNAPLAARRTLWLGEMARRGARC